MRHLCRATDVLLMSVLLFSLATGVASLTAARQAKEAALVPSDEYPVYNAVLADVEFSQIKPEKDVRALIVDDTVSLECGAESKNPILLNNCSPMLVPPATTQDIHALLKQNFRFEGSTWNDFLQKNAKTWKLQNQFITPWKHGLTGSDIDPKSLPSPEWDDPDCAFYFSRVGFDKQGEEAIVFVFFASYLDQAPSSGDYFLLRQKQGAGWKIEGRANYFKSGGQSDKSSDQG